VIMVTDFKRGGEQNIILPVEASGKVSLSDRLVRVNNTDLPIGISLREAVLLIRDACTEPFDATASPKSFANMPTSLPRAAIGLQSPGILPPLPPASSLPSASSNNMTGITGASPNEIALFFKSASNKEVKFTDYDPFHGLGTTENVDDRAGMIQELSSRHDNWRVAVNCMITLPEPLRKQADVTHLVMLAPVVNQTVRLHDKAKIAFGVLCFDQKNTNTSSLCLFKLENDSHHKQGMHSVIGDICSTLSPLPFKVKALLCLDEMTPYFNGNDAIKGSFLVYGSDSCLYLYWAHVATSSENVNDDEDDDDYDQPAQYLLSSRRISTPLKSVEVNGKVSLQMSEDRQLLTVFHKTGDGVNSKADLYWNVNKYSLDYKLERTITVKDCSNKQRG
jgi:hypothetical protein